MFSRRIPDSVAHALAGGPGQAVAADIDGNKVVIVTNSVAGSFQDEWSGLIRFFEQEHLI